jgi:hypothetical protein
VAVFWIGDSPHSNPLCVPLPDTADAKKVDCAQSKPSASGRASRLRCAASTLDLSKRDAHVDSAVMNASAGNELLTAAVIKALAVGLHCKVSTM